MMGKVGLYVAGTGAEGTNVFLGWSRGQIRQQKKLLRFARQNTPAPGVPIKLNAGYATELYSTRSSNHSLSTFTVPNSTADKKCKQCIHI